MIFECSDGNLYFCKTPIKPILDIEKPEETFKCIAGYPLWDVNDEDATMIESYCLAINCHAGFTRNFLMKNENTGMAICAPGISMKFEPGVGMTIDHAKSKMNRARMNLLVCMRLLLFAESVDTDLRIIWPSVIHVFRSIKHFDAALAAATSQGLIDNMHPIGSSRLIDFLQSVLPADVFGKMIALNFVLPSSIENLKLSKYTNKRVNEMTTLANLETHIQFIPSTKPDPLCHDMTQANCIRSLQLYHEATAPSLCMPKMTMLTSLTLIDTNGSTHVKGIAAIVPQLQHLYIGGSTSKMAILENNIAVECFDNMIMFNSLTSFEFRVYGNFARPHNFEHHVLQCPKFFQPNLIEVLRVADNYKIHVIDFDGFNALKTLDINARDCINLGSSVNTLTDVRLTSCSQEAINSLVYAQNLTSLELCGDLDNPVDVDNLMHAGVIDRCEKLIIRDIRSFSHRFPRDTCVKILGLVGVAGTIDLSQIMSQLISLRIENVGHFDNMWMNDATSLEELYATDSSIAMLGPKPENIKVLAVSKMMTGLEVSRATNIIALNIADFNFNRSGVHDRIDMASMKNLRYLIIGKNQININTYDLNNGLKLVAVDDMGIENHRQMVVKLRKSKFLYGHLHTKSNVDQRMDLQLNDTYYVTEKLPRECGSFNFRHSKHWAVINNDYELVEYMTKLDIY